MSGAPEIKFAPAPCPTCGARTTDEAGPICRPSSDETGEVFCPGDRTDAQGRILQPTPESLAALDAWIDAQVEMDPTAHD